MKDHDQAGFHVLIVEDHPDYQILITHALRVVAPSTVIRTAASSDEALRCLHSTEPAPDLILLDIRLPGPSGFEVLRQVKQDLRSATSRWSC